MIDLLEETKKGAENFMAGLGGMMDTFLPTEKDPSSGPVEDISELAARFLNIGEQAGLFLTDTIGLPSVRKMVKELTAEYEASDLVCDKIGGQSLQIGIPFLPDPTICISPKQFGWALQPNNLPKLGQMAISCGIEENITEPIDYWLSLGKIIQGGDYENLSGFVTGLLSGEGFPDIVNPVKWLIGPFSFSACVQTKIAEEMGDMSKEEVEKLAKGIHEFTGRDTGMAKNLLKNVGL